MSTWVCSGLSVLLHLSVSLFFVPVPRCFDDCVFVLYSEARECDFSSCALSQDCFGYVGSSVFPTHFKSFSSSSIKNAIDNLIGISVQSVDCLGSATPFNNIDSSNPRTWFIFPFVCVVFNFFHWWSYSFQSIGLLPP